MLMSAYGARLPGPALFDAVPCMNNADIRRPRTRARPSEIAGGARLPGRVARCERGRSCGDGPRYIRRGERAWRPATCESMWKR